MTISMRRRRALIKRIGWETYSKLSREARQNPPAPFFNGRPFSFEELTTLTGEQHGP